MQNHLPVLGVSLDLSLGHTGPPKQVSLNVLVSVVYPWNSSRTQKGPREWWLSELRLSLRHKETSESAPLRSEVLMEIMPPWGSLHLLDEQRRIKDLDT